MQRYYHGARHNCSGQNIKLELVFSAWTMGCIICLESKGGSVGWDSDHKSVIVTSLPCSAGFVAL